MHMLDTDIYYFQADTAMELQRWVAAINTVVSNSGYVTGIALVGGIEAAMKSCLEWGLHSLTMQ